MIRVAFDDIFLSLADSGISRVWSQVLPRIVRNTQDEDGLEVVVLNRSDKLKKSGAKIVDFPEFDFQHPAADRQLLTKMCTQLEVDVFVSSYFTFVPAVRSVLMVYDLIPERFGFHQESRGWLERQLALVQATRYVCISASTRSDLHRFYPEIPRETSVVAHPGIDQDVFVRASDEVIKQFRDEHGLARFAVMVGSRHQHHGYKNGDLVVQALADGGIHDLDLVVVGGETLTPAESAAAAKAGVRIVRLILDDFQLATCLSAAEVLLYPSLSEGFGMPPLEALSVGTPVVVTAATSLPEAVGPLGLYCSGTNVEEFRHKVAMAIRPSWQGEIRALGPRWSARFEWDRLADAVEEAIYCAHRQPESTSEGETAAFLENYTNCVKEWQR